MYGRRRSRLSDPSFRGVFPSLPTICKKDGKLDEKGQRSVVRYCIDEGADGVACLLFAGEFYKLSDTERKKVARVVVDEAGGEVPVLIGVSHSGTLPSVELGRHARDINADGIIVTPPYHANFAAESRLSLLRHYEEIARRVALPIMIQDYETQGGVHLSAQEIDTITRLARNVLYVKVEGDNQLNRIRGIIRRTRGRIGVFGGMAGYHLLEEMPLGIQGTMPGAGMVGQIVDIFAAQKQGDTVTARKRFKLLKPYLDFFIAHFDSFTFVEKEVLRARGVIENSTVRGPAVPLSQSAALHLARLLHNAGIERVPT
jgi:4-hydroxy-tetrahydrodipicolinate synthase